MCPLYLPPRNVDMTTVSYKIKIKLSFVDTADDVALVYKDLNPETT